MPWRRPSKTARFSWRCAGRFHWKNLMDYAVRQGGSCHNSFCTAPSSRPNRRISFYPVRPDLMAMAISQDDFAAYQVTRKSGKLTLAPPHRASLGAGSGRGAARCRFLAGRHQAVRFGAAERRADPVHARDPKTITCRCRSTCTCRDAAGRIQLCSADFENTTETLRKWIAREHQQPQSGGFERRAGGRNISPRRSARVRPVAHSARVRGRDGERIVLGIRIDPSPIGRRAEST